ncbi:MAG: hypothetical protein GY847_35050 [Proteobacteria bacterium]|nr:hypothetical protein [Pseudomonadota bacterium]
MDTLIIAKTGDPPMREIALHSKQMVPLEITAATVLTTDHLHRITRHLIAHPHHTMTGPVKDRGKQIARMIDRDLQLPTLSDMSTLKTIAPLLT